jgi:hypothetical protein
VKVPEPLLLDGLAVAGGALEADGLLDGAGVGSALPLPLPLPEPLPAPAVAVPLGVLLAVLVGGVAAELVEVW